MSESKELTLPERAAVALGAPKYEQEIRDLVAKTVTITEVKNKDGRDQCHGAMMTLKNARVAIEKAAKNAREDATAFSKAVIAEEKRLVALAAPEEARLQALRDEWDAEREREKQAKAEAERQRVKSIRDKIDVLGMAATSSVALSAAKIAAVIETVEAEPITLETHMEFAGEAEMVKSATLDRLRGMLAAQREHEAEQARLAAERAELERLRAEAAERDRLAALARQEEERQARAAREREEAERREREARDRAERARVDAIKQRIADIRATVAMQAGKPSASMESAISALQAMDMSGFDEHFDEAETARHDATVRLGEMAAAMREHEEQRAQLAREAAALEAKRREVEQQERERLAAIEAENQRKRAEEAARAAAERLEADHAEALAENDRIDAERAEAARIAAEQAAAAEAERQRIANTPAPQPVEMVTIPKAEYERLLERDEWLSCLEAAGVDNWQGIDEAIQIRKEEQAA